MYLHPISIDSDITAEQVLQAYGKGYGVQPGESAGEWNIIVQDDSITTTHVDSVADSINVGDPYVPEVSPEQELKDNVQMATTLDDVKQALVTFAERFTAIPLG